MIDNRPSLFFDSETIKHLRQEVQRPWEKDEFWMYFVMRRFSIYISRTLAQKTKVSPNALTIMGILFGLASAASYMIGSVSAILWGFLCYQLCYFFDCIDGEVARLSNRSSAGGEWLDIGLNYAMALSNIGIVYGLFQSSPSYILGTALFVTLVTTFAIILSSEGAMLVLRQSASQATVLMRKKNRVTDSVVFLFMTEIGFHFGILPCGLIWLIWGFKTPLLIWAGYFVCTSLLKAIYKLKTNLREI